MAPIGRRVPKGPRRLKVMQVVYRPEAAVLAS